MRKMAVMLIVLLSACSVVCASSEDGRTQQGMAGRQAIVVGRGLLNILGVPFEAIRTPMAEWETHKALWPVTVLPRTGSNILIRAASALNDLIVYPWMVPFTDDLSPITEPFELPEYVWSRR